MQAGGDKAIADLKGYKDKLGAQGDRTFTDKWNEYGPEGVMGKAEKTSEKALRVGNCCRGSV